MRDSDNPVTIFVVGNSRSGTTMMARLLGVHSGVHTFHELHFFEELWSGVRDASGGAHGERIAARLINVERDDYIGEQVPERYLSEARRMIAGSAVDEADPVGIFRAFLAYEARRNKKRIACEQTPRNVFYLREILDAFPAARILNMVRDPRAVLASQKNRWKIRARGAKEFPVREVIRSWINYHPILTAALWNSSVRAAAAVAEDKRVRIQVYETFVDDPEVSLRKICAFVGINYEPAMLELPRSAGGLSSYHDPGRHSESGIDAAAATRWQDGMLNTGELLLCQLICRRWLRRYGYEPVRNAWVPGIFFAMLYALMLPLQVLVALLMNVSRHRSLLGSIRRRLGT